MSLGQAGQLGGGPWPRGVFLSGQAISLLGDGLAVLAVPLLVLDLSRSPLVSALSAASVTVGYLMVGLPAGVLVDRLDAWRVLLVTDALRAGLFAALFGFATAGLLTVWLVLAIAFVAGACSVFFETALVVVVKDLFPAARLIRANSVLELASQLSLVAGPAVVGVLAAVGSISLALLADALTFALSLVSLLAVGRWRSRPQAGRESRGWRAMGTELRAGLRYLASVRVLVILTAVQIVVNLCLAVEKLIIFDARDTLGLTASLVAVVVAAGGVGGVIGALSASRLAGWIGEIRLVVVAIAAAGVAIASMSAAGSALSLAAANLGYGWALVVASLVNRTQRQRIVPRAMLGRVTGVVRVLFLAVDPLGVVIAGTATAALGGDPRPVFLAAGLVVVATAAAGWLAGLRRAGHDGGRGSSAGPAR
jgi:predicted MFS family arabinose efflux permease